MTYAQVLALIQQWIVANGNNEITANVLRPILEAMLNQPNDLIGDLDNLQTGDKTNLVAAINEIISQSLALLPTKEIATTPYDITTDDLNRPLMFTSNNQVVNIPTTLVADAVTAGLTLFDFKAHFTGTGTHTVNYPGSETWTGGQDALVYALCIDTSGDTEWIIKDWSLLKEITTDSYNGNRLSPLGRPHGFQVDKNGNISVGYRTSNNGTGNGALAGYIASVDPTYASAISMAFYGANYFITELRNRGAISSSNNIFYRSRGDAADTGHEFQTGATPETQVTRLKIHSDRTETSNDVVVKSNGQQGYLIKNLLDEILVRLRNDTNFGALELFQPGSPNLAEITPGNARFVNDDGILDLFPIAEEASTEITLNNVLGNYNATPDWNATYTTASPVAGGNATLLIDTTGQTGFPSVTGATLVPFSPFVSGKTYAMRVWTLDGTTVYCKFFNLTDGDEVSPPEDLIPKVNFYDLAEKSKSNFGKIAYRKISLTECEVVFPIDGDLYGFVDFVKDVNDDYVKLGAIGYCNYGIVGLVDEYINATLNGTFGGTASNQFTTTVNDTIDASFNGVGCEFTHQADNRGGIWEFVVDGDTANAKTLSTWAVSSGVITQKLFIGLSDGAHTIVGTFKGDDPDNPPTGGTSRGWVRIGNEISQGSFPIYGSQGLGVDGNVTNILNQGSNKEFAISARLSGSANARQLIPDHGTGTAFGDVSLFVDGIDVSEETNQDFFTECDRVELINEMTGKNTIDDVDLVDIQTSVIVTAKGVEVNNLLEFIEDTDLSLGYVNMIPVNIGTFGKVFLDSQGNGYDITITDNSLTPFNYKNNLLSVAVIDDSIDKENMFLGVQMNDISESFKVNKTNYRGFDGFETRFWLQHRDAVINKLYVQAYFNEIIPSGFRHYSSMNLTVGKIRKAYDKLYKTIINV